MAKEQETSNCSSSYNDYNTNTCNIKRKSKIPVAGLNPHALAFHQGRPSHVEPHPDEKMINEHMDAVQNHWNGAFEAVGGLRLPHMPYINLPNGVNASDPSYHSPADYKAYPNPYTDPASYQPMNMPIGSYYGYPSQYLPNYNGGFASNYGHGGNGNYVNPADPFAGQLYEVQTARHGGAVRGYAPRYGYGCGDPDGYDGADERIGGPRIGGKKKKKGKKMRNAQREDMGKGAAWGKRRQYGQMVGGD
ncbi:hypothetical protein T440DRAFT_513756 [Plenodomus tracheiphilus IPT5]|uniref:Uncharacterized protein n=1 Tax=Plenodomus tracheiphilus IPT5 TaxID=1408161 RepID=A0A6A7BK39_9PLEO|nr:hypothetical protein T440DRAFT_513756 [Plenodomus tracheiphilus IPT5]